MPRLLFEKKGNSVWISHLDLMRLFQRAFKRADLPLKHTQGFNPRPSVSIALPLSVGVESECELMDFDLDGGSVPAEQIKERLNCALTEGVRVLDVYDTGRKLKELSYLSCQVLLEFDVEISDASVDRIRQLFCSEQIILPKKTKNGIQEQNIIPMIRRIDVLVPDSHSLILEAQICCQNPSLNPMQLALAVSTYLPELTPCFSSCKRVEIYDPQGSVFR